ncbi:hypothetical protein FUA23_21690 [Neolewinella aurantiaca]|uniref:Lipoprotein n=1 Tax=Neolewinella aurantiaca TaxID=2602767 RepID=A0A5C7FFI0_9BACT|nr:hypothetical protein [Neolewinella aurantiaca]TXF83084.1 hypothetical protein FUA23_21690 [Neolewinella aurantiaca]
MNTFLTYAMLAPFLCIILISSGCTKDSCGGDMKMIGDQFLNDEISGSITHTDYPGTVIFVDSDGNEFEFLKVENNLNIERKEIPDFGECDNGLMFTPYYNIEKFKLTYVSSIGEDTISIEILPWVSRAATRENILTPDDQTQIGRDQFSVKLAFPDCPVVNTFQYLEDDRGASEINSVPFPRSKFQQTYSDTYGVRRAWSNEVWFSYSRGIVAFNYCDKNYAQVIN